MTDDFQRWEARYQQSPPLSLPHPLLAELRPLLPPPGRALDLACGLAPNAAQLLDWGWAVTAADISPTALGRVQARHPAVQICPLDLRRDPLPAGPWDLIVCQNYLDRGLFAAMAAALVRGGALVFRQPTTENLTRHARPSRRFLLEPGEAVRLVEGAGLAAVWSREGWSAGRCEGQVLGLKK